MKMSNRFMSPLPTFTLESLVTNGQWTAAQNARKKSGAKPESEKKTPGSSPEADKTSKKPAL